MEPYVLMQDQMEEDKEIPKILHQLAPKNKKDWHPIWFECQKSWLNHFNSFKYEMWDDERINKFVKKEYTFLYKVFNECPIHIIKLDMVRYMILYKYGGIYADMDIFCYKNFYDKLNKKTILVQAQTSDEIVQNSLMISSKKNIFFKNILNKSFNKLKKLKNKISFEDNIIKNTAGPYLLSSFIKNKTKDIQILSNKEYNINPKDYHEKAITKHMLTGRWGKQVIEILKKRAKLSDNQISIQEHSLIDYSNVRDINYQLFNFYKKYYG